MSESNQWAAEQCGVELRQISCGDESRAHMFKHKGKAHWHQWTLDDARCREVVREHFMLTTYWDNDGEVWCDCDKPNMMTFSEAGTTIAEAEINCIKAIREAQA